MKAMEKMRKMILVWICVGCLAIATANPGWTKDWWWEEIPYTLNGMHMVLGTDGTPYFAGVDNGSLYFAWRVPAGWSRELVTSGEIGAVSLAIDPTNTPHIAYDRTEGGLRYLEHAWRSQDAWSIERVATVGIRGYRTGLVIAPNGAIGLVYLAPRAGEPPEDGSPYLFFAEKVGSNWTHTFIDQVSAVVTNIVRGGLRYDSSSQPHLAYNRAYNGAMLYATRFEGIWSTEEVYYTSWGDYDGILRLDSVGQPVIAFWDWMFDGKLSWRSDGTWHTEDAPWGWRQEHNFAIDRDDNVRALVYSWYYSYAPYQYYHERDAATGTWWQDPSWPWGRDGTGLLNIEIDGNGLTRFAISTRNGPLIYGGEIPGMPDITVSPATYDFGDIQVGNSTELMITVTNDGSADLVIGTIAATDPLTNPYSIENDDCSAQTVSPGESRQLTVGFSPTSIGTFTDTFDIPSNDPDENPVTVNLSGTGVIDSTIPTGSITINSGAPSTNSMSVTLSLAASDDYGVTGLYISESYVTPSISDPGWFPINSTISYSEDIPFRLSDGPGTKTVYAWFRDEAGNVSTVVSDSIDLDIMTGFWRQKTTGLYGGGVDHLVVNSSGEIFAGTSAGLFHSTDNGVTWTEIGEGLPYNNINALAVSPTGDIFVGFYGLHRSHDNGETWVATHLRNTNVTAIVINSQGDILVATYESGLFRSTDNGETWSPIANDFAYIWVGVLAVNSSDHIFAGTEEGIYRSTDDGESWTQMNNGLTNTSVASLAVNSSGHIFVGTWSWGSDGGVYRSTNDGEDWTQINNGLTNTTVPSLAINSSGHVFAGTWRGGIFRSTDNGENWIYKGLTNTAVRSLAVNSLDQVFAGTDGEGVFCSADNGDSWIQTNNGLKAVSVRALASNLSSDNVLAGTWNNGLYLSNNNGESWDNMGFTQVTIEAVAINSLGHMFVAPNDVFRSTDNGTTWQQLTSGLDLDPACFAIGSSGDIFAGTQDGVFRSTDNGEIWTQINNGLTSTNITALAIDSSGDIFAGAWSEIGGVFLSTDNGETWVNVGLTNIAIRSLAINSSDHIFAGTGWEGIFRSVDNGETWVNVGLTNNDVYSLAINTQGRIFAGTLWGGVFRSADNGESWVNTGLTGRDVYSLSVNSSGYIFAGTDAGVFRGPEICEGDFDCDGDIDGSDLAAFAEVYAILDPSADLNDDETVDAGDLALFAEDLGRANCPASP